MRKTMSQMQHNVIYSGSAGNCIPENLILKKGMISCRITSETMPSFSLYHIQEFRQYHYQKICKKQENFT